MDVGNENENMNVNNKNKSINDDGMIQFIVIKTYKINSDLSKKHVERLIPQNKLDNVRTMLLKKKESDSDDFHMGSNCRFLHFSRDNAEIKPNDESKFNLLEIIEKRDDNYFLHIVQNSEFDLAQLRFEKGFKFNKDGSITNAPFQAFKINIDEINIEEKNEHYDKVYVCNHETTVKCKRPLIFDVKLSTACSELVSTSIGFSHENSDQTHTQHITYTKRKCELVVRGALPILKKNISVEKNFVEDVKKVLNDTNQNDKINKLHEISEKYGHFYVRRLIFGGAIIKNEEHTKNSVEHFKVKATNVNAQVDVGIAANSLKAGVNAGVKAGHSSEDTRNNYNDNTNNIEAIIGGTDYSKDDENPWRQSLNDPTTWKIIGYEEAYSLFDLLDDELKKDVLNVMGHQILEARVDELSFNIREHEKNKNPLIHKLLITNKMIDMHKCNILASIMSEKTNVFSLHVEYIGGNKNRPIIVVHHIQQEKKANWFNNQDNQIKIKLGWVIIGPPTDFGFSIQYPLALKSGTHRVLEENDYHIIKNCGMFGTCALEAANIVPQSNNRSDTRAATSRKIVDPTKSPYVIGNYLTRKESLCQESLCQDSTRLFIYDIKNKKRVTDGNILKQLVLYSCTVDETSSRQIDDFFGEMKFNWIKGRNKKILYSSKEFKISNNNLILVNQIFDHDDCKNCKPRGFVNAISGKIFYGSLNTEQMNIEDMVGSIVYLSIPPKFIDKEEYNLFRF
ncbi:hsp70 family protein [Gigaspora margarita]|uniref:Hsp70 family protein n=1 Tax=Gigaspora margarita TaxID=4874 RepID=A0A8H3X713_GIGMA|nr:hsp70 family protein [Gigaspora margarita]